MRFAKQSLDQSIQIHASLMRVFPKLTNYRAVRTDIFALEGVLNLEDFERFVFIMFILEHYSDYDCALLLGCSVREILEARARALRELMDSIQQKHSLENQRAVYEMKEKK